MFEDIRDLVFGFCPVRSLPLLHTDIAQEQTPLLKLIWLLFTRDRKPASVIVA